MESLSVARSVSPLACFGSTAKFLGYAKKLNSSVETVRANCPQTSATFYRPELDLLRLVAFLLVFVLHGPRLTESGNGVTVLKETIAFVFNRFALAGQAGLPLFFFLSSYLITELLLRERERTGRIHRKAFYLRRILRIWPLYYLGVVLAIVTGLVLPEFSLNRHEILYLLTFTAWFGEVFHGNPFGVLWSISVEEVFYLLWPTIAGFGTNVLKWTAILLIPIAPFTLKLFRHGWYNPGTHFIFFATGGLIAILLHERLWSLPDPLRIPAFVSGIVCFGIVRFVEVNESLVYFALDIGCVLLFLSVLGMPKQLLSPRVLYLGKISYGLYVFHLAVYRLITPKILFQPFRSELLSLALTYVVTLATTVCIAAVSYRYFETPFLNLKKRFELVRSRPV